MNTSGQTAASADSALTATSAEIGVLAWVPKTMELLSIDLPNPNPASGYAVTSLALNINPVAGYVVRIFVIYTIRLWICKVVLVLM